MIGKVVHFEIPADNLNRADKFYSTVFGWKLEKTKGMEDQYHMAQIIEVDRKNMTLKESGAINGALMTKEGLGTDHPVIVIAVPSLDESLKKVQKAGGKIVMPKQKVMDMGWYARVTDSEGNVIGVWETIPMKR